MEKAEKERKQKLSLRFVLTRTVVENSKKIAKKFKKFKNSTLASFQAKIGWKRLRKRENKNYRSVSFLLDADRKFQKKWKKLKKIKKNTVLALFKAKIGWKMPRKTENKDYRSVSFLPDAK